jgi:hypothetical protein
VQSSNERNFVCLTDDLTHIPKAIAKQNVNIEIADAIS